ncbi:MAG: bifunctional diaminohydroxyphosphoribosylaminopyrimidine deaminase/5-amino-6-(5-phosphoribosylamino)uracil reductase RibD [Dehalococcoidia bacterium]
MTDYMQYALSLARKALGSVSPNPAVGAVVLNKEGRIVGQGYTQPPGSAHAEIVALQQAGEEARGGTMYVTLEPCCHQGKTPPCTKAIIGSGIREVHIATLDPNPMVGGKGKVILEADGIRMHIGEREEEAKELNEAYLKFITTGRPFVTAKFAMSLDGKIATKKHNAKWISNEWSRERAHRLRWETDAIMVGINTVLEDNPQLTARTLNGTREPLRVILDSQGQTPTDAKALENAERVLIATTEAMSPSRRDEYGTRSIEVLTLPAREGHVDLGELLRVLGEKEITGVIAEGGGTLLGSLFDDELVDKVIAFISPMIIGGSEAISPVGGKGAELISQALKLKRTRIEQFVDDIMVTGYTR